MASRKRKIIFGIVAAILLTPAIAFCYFKIIHKTDPGPGCALPAHDTACEYDTLYLPAIIIETSTVENGTMVKLSADTSAAGISGKDVPYIPEENIKTITVSAEDFQKANLHKGDLITCVLYKRRYIACGNDYAELGLSRYKNTSAK